MQRDQLARATLIALFTLTVASLSGTVLVLRYALVSLGGDGGAESLAAATAAFRPIPLLNLIVAATLAATGVLLPASGGWRALARRTRVEVGLALPFALLLWLLGIATSHGSHVMILLVAAGWTLLGAAAWRARAALAR